MPSSEHCKYFLFTFTCLYIVTEKRPGICDVEISERAPAPLCSINTWEQVVVILCHSLVYYSVLFVMHWVMVEEICVPCCKSDILEQLQELLQTSGLF